jgi:hypothetical protein
MVGPEPRDTNSLKRRIDFIVIGTETPVTEWR